MTIVYIAAAFIIGVIVTAILKKCKSTGISEKELTQVRDEKSKLEKKLSEIESEKASLAKRLADSTSAESVDDIKKRYENLLNEVKSQCAELDKKLKNALDGKIDDDIKEKLAEADKLKKKIKDLEDEIEDNEDDISDLKKKVRNKESDLEEAQNELSKEQKISKQLNKDLEAARTELENKVEELNLKVSSQNFIQEILSAKEISTGDTKKLVKNIDFMESFIKGAFTDINSFLFNQNYLLWNNNGGQKGWNEKKTYFYNAFDQWASTKRKSWLDGKTTIAFVGEFSAGKTSIVNRILSQDDPSVPKLPVSTKATTAVPTYIAGASSTTYSFISGDGKRKTILEDTFKKVSKEVLDQVKGISSLIKYFIMTYKNPNLNGLSILDTPGFNSNDKEDRDRTIDVINECDALFWVFDVNAGTVNRSSIQVIKEKLNKPLYVVINKVDTKAKSDVDKVEQLIRKTLSDEGLKVEKFIRFSSKAQLQDIMNPIKSVTRTNVRDTFVDDVENDLNSLLEIMDNFVKENNKSYNNALQKGDNITNQFIDCLKNMQTDCADASNIPHWEEHLFSSDRYEMDASEGDRLIELLENISDSHVKNVANIFDKRVDMAEKIQLEWSNLCNFKMAFEKTNECYEQYKKIAKNLR